MLVVAVEIWPGGDRSRKVRIAEATAANVSELSEVSDYKCRVTATGCADLGIEPIAENFKIEDHHRADGALELVRRMFAAAILRVEAKKDATI